MKLQSNHLLENITTSELKDLTQVVKETVALEFKKEKRRIFSAAQLWDIHKRKRTFSAKRILF